MRKHFEFLLLISFFIASNCAADASDETQISAAKTVVEKLHIDLLESMQSGEIWSYAERYIFLEPTIEASFDFEKISQLVLSRYWKDLSDTQKNKFKELMQRLSTLNYAKRFNQFGGEIFTIISAEKAKRQRILVKTEIKTADKTHNIDYMLHQREGDWLIISVTANGINELAIKRSEYASILKTEDFDTLFEKIEQQISRIETQ